MNLHGYEDHSLERGTFQCRQSRRDIKCIHLVQGNEDVPQKEGNYVVELAPKESNPTLAKLVLTVNAKTFTVTQADVIDELGNVTRTRFMDIKTNVSRPD